MITEVQRERLIQRYMSDNLDLDYFLETGQLQYDPLEIAPDITAEELHEVMVTAMHQFVATLPEVEG